MICSFQDIFGKNLLLKSATTFNYVDTSLSSIYLSKMKKSMELAIKKYDSISLLYDSFTKSTLYLNKNLVERRKGAAIFILEKMGDGIVSKNIKVDSIGLASAILNFQKRHQIKEDGLFNEKNISLILKDLDRTKIKLKNSLLRLKRLELPNETMVFINIPDYNLKYIDEAGVELLSCPVIVGKPSWPSKTMISAIDEVVFCPYWNIPNGILSKEIMPLVRKQKNYLQKHNMEWKNGRLRQKPGKSNALGFIKFIFPNPYHIYLHDTPNRNLFLKQKRAFSHGCIRLYCVNELAKMLLKQDESWILNRASSCDKGEESRVKLKVKMRIVIVYTTAWVNSRGQVEIRDDIYNKDK